MNFVNCWSFFIIFVAFLRSIQTEELLVGSKDTCTKLRNIYSESLLKLDHCMLENAVPVRVCRSCVALYVENVQAFRNLTLVSDPKVPRKRCSDHFMNQDTLNVVWQRYQSSRNLWDNAACTSCFVEQCDPDKIANVTEICKLNPQMIAFNQSVVDLHLCFNKTDQIQGDVCKECLGAFNTIQDNLKKLPVSSNGVCFEAVDQFNRTSNIWYEDKRCPKPKVLEISLAWEIVIILIGLLLLSGISYGGFYAFTVYRQRGNYVEQMNSEEGNVTPPIYS